MLFVIVYSKLLHAHGMNFSEVDNFDIIFSLSLLKCIKIGKMTTYINVLNLVLNYKD